MAVFDGINDAQALTGAWKDDYNPQRRYSSLDELTPVAFASACAASSSPKASVPAAQAETHGPTRS